MTLPVLLLLFSFSPHGFFFLHFPPQLPCSRVCPCLLSLSMKTVCSSMGGPTQLHRERCWALVGSPGDSQRVFENRVSLGPHFLLQQARGVNTSTTHISTQSLSVVGKEGTRHKTLDTRRKIHGTTAGVRFRGRLGGERGPVYSTNSHIIPHGLLSSRVYNTFK